MGFAVSQAGKTRVSTVRKHPFWCSALRFKNVQGFRYENSRNRPYARPDFSFFVTSKDPEPALPTHLSRSDTTPHTTPVLLLI